MLHPACTALACSSKLQESGPSSYWCQEFPVPNFPEGLKIPSQTRNNGTLKIPCTPRYKPPTPLFLSLLRRHRLSLFGCRPLSACHRASFPLLLLLRSTLSTQPRPASICFLEIFTPRASPSTTPLVAMYSCINQPRGCRGRVNQRGAKCADCRVSAHCSATESLCADSSISREDNELTTPQ